MFTIRAATSLLAQASSLDGLSPLVRKLGFETPLLPVSSATLATLGVADHVTEARLGSGVGNLRVFVARLAGDSPFDARELTRRTGAALVRNAPTRLWCVIALDGAGDLLCLAAISAHPDGPRIAALRVERNRIVDSDADTVRALAGIPLDHDRLVHTRWSDILRRDALSSRFYRTLEKLVRQMALTATGRATAEERSELALLCTSRLLFLAFLEAKGWLAANRGFLLTHCTNQLERGGQLHEKFLRPLFFGTLNTPGPQRAALSRAFGSIPFLNGGLFSPTRLEQQRRTLRFTDDAITAVIGDLLDKFRFTAREDSSTWSESAVDPEMLGRAFECLMASDERRKSGSFYTPPSLVQLAVNDALRACIPDLQPHTVTVQQAAQLESLRVLDPACGSGAFLVHMLEHLALLLQNAGDQRPIHTLRREVLTRSIFGVDRNPMAVWLCELRLWLSVVIECPETRPSRIPPLPNLDHHIRVGDTLSAGNLQFASPSARTLASLRTRYARATGIRKRTLGRALDGEERKRALGEMSRMIVATTNERRDLLQTVRQRDLFGTRALPSRAERSRLVALRSTLREQRLRSSKVEMGGALPFRFAAHFADVAAAGFDIVIGNPPWVRPHNLPIAERARLRVEYQTLRDAAWRVGANRAGAGAGFSAQADLSVAFVERGTQLLKPTGVLALLLPAKLWRSLAGGGVRRFLTSHAHLHTVRDWSDASAMFDAAVYPSLLVATRTRTTERVRVSVARHAREHVFDIEPHLISMGADAGAPWLLLPPDVRDAFERLRRSGPALGDSALGRPLLGVKCGLNSAFLVRATEHDDDTATIVDDEHSYVVERTLLRPALRGDAIATGATRSTRASVPDLRIFWTHALDGKPLRTLPPRTSRWFARYRSQLELRRDARARQPWWTLFRTEAARIDATRLVWADLGRTLRTAILPAGDPTVPLNTCYVLRTASHDDACALNTILTSPLAAAWLDAIAEPARGGWRRFLGWTVAALPVPADWNAVRTPLANFYRLQHAGVTPSAEQHLAVVAAAYGIPLDELVPLLHWHSR